MVDNGSFSDLKKQLAAWLDHILEGIRKDLIASEQDVENKVRVISDKEREKALFNTGATLFPSLLELLGYSLETCDDHPVITVIQAGQKLIKTIPDYIVKSSDQKDLAIWELKAPNEDVDGNGHVAQLRSYCIDQKRQTAIGILFNGRKIRVFINPDYPGLGKYKKISDEPEKTRAFDFRCSPVLSLDLDSPKSSDKTLQKAVVDVLIGLSLAKLSGKSVVYARSLAEKKLAEGKDKERNRKIVVGLHKALSNPTDQVIAAIASVISEWDGLDSAPQTEDAVAAWHKRKDNTTNPQTIKTVEIQAKQSINSIVRQKVVQLCTSKSYNFLDKANVKGLRLRNEGGNGYHPVPQAEGVPSNLFVGGLSSEDAKKVIYQLDALLSQ